MLAATLDRRVRKEARLLMREAQAIAGRPGELQTATKEIEDALAANDMLRVRRALPALDTLVDELGKNSGKSITRDYVESIGAAIMIAIVVRFLVIEAFKIPSSSMYPTLQIGDHIFVNKFIYGVRIPGTGKKILPLRQPARGDVIVFQQPCERERDYIKRVIALENDTVEVRCNVVYVNGAAVPQKLVDANCQYDDFDELTRKWSTKLCSRYTETVNGNSYDTFQDPDLPERNKVLADAGGLTTGDEKDFPKLDHILLPPSCATNPDGEPLAAPNQKPGQIVSEHPELIHEAAAACQPKVQYVVPPGHVFVMGDNRANSNDSRYWGSVPIENIRGKALFIWFSYPEKFWDPTQYRWDRLGDFVD
ncbi:MAG TPA: signal peptidase I [Kofleriaceae bacterium]